MDGVDVTSADTYAGNNADNPSNSIKIGAGNYNSSEAPNHFAGKMDELAVYGRSLLDQELWSIYLRELRWYRASDYTLLLIDDDAPTVQLATTYPYRAVGYTQLMVQTADPTSVVTLLDVGIKAPGSSRFVWQGAVECADNASPGVAWCPSFDSATLGGEGVYEFKFRAVDAVGNETTSSTYQLIVDGTPPVAASSYSNSWISANETGGDTLAWTIPLNGTISDPNIGSAAGSGVVANTVKVALVNGLGLILDGSAQLATVSGGTWSLDYVAAGERPFGPYTVVVYAEDAVGNSVETAVGTILLDERPPSSDINLWQLPPAVISQTLILSGTVSEAEDWGGALARYHFEEASGATTFHDSSVQQNHATCTNCPNVTAGLFGQGVAFNGTDDTVEIPNLFDPSSDPFSISLWFNAASAGNGTTRVLVQQDNGTGQGRTLLYLQPNNQLASNLGGYLASQQTVSLDTWHHVSLTWDGTILSLYLDGVLANAGTPTAEAANGGLQLGSNRSATAFFPGTMDEVVFFDHALSAYAVYVLAQDEVYGTNAVEVGFEQIDFATLNSGAAAPLSNAPATVWQAATVENTGVNLSIWSLLDDATVENYFKILLRGTDADGNVSGVATVWRGLIDRVPPQVTATGAHMGDSGNPETEYSYSFSDFLLDETNFVMPCSGGDVVNTTYSDTTLPYDGLPYQVTATCRVAGWETSRDVTACDVAGHCTTVTVAPDSSCAAPTAVSDLAVTPSGAQVTLSWTHGTSNTDYRVFRFTAPYFSPTDSGVVELTGSIGYSGGMASIVDSDVILGNPAVNFYYYVVGVNGCGAETAVSNHTGAFDFGIVPGTP